MVKNSFKMVENKSNCKWNCTPSAGFHEDPGCTPIEPKSCFVAMLNHYKWL